MKKLSLLLVVLLSLVGLNLGFAGVQMSSFIQTIDSVWTPDGFLDWDNSKVIFNWSTSSEANSYGFVLEWNYQNEAGHWIAQPTLWKSLGSTGGSYSYECSLRGEGNTYRLRQIDNDAKLSYFYPVIEVISVPPVIEPPIVDPPVDTTTVPPVVDPPVDTTSVPPVDDTTTVPPVDPPSTGVETENYLPNKLHLSANYPNPFNPSTHIQFSVSQSGYATLKVYNILGQEIAILFSGNARAGQNIQASFNGSGLASGVYFARLESNGQSLVQRMLMSK